MVAMADVRDCGFELVDHHPPYSEKTHLAEKLTD